MSHIKANSLERATNMDDNDAYERRDTIFIAGQGIPERWYSQQCRDKPNQRKVEHGYT